MMDQSIPNKQSSDIIYGEGYIHTGPLTAQHYEISTKSEDMISTENNRQYHFKVMLLGDSGVGRSLFFFCFI
jgi:hypothetical protein